jgi:WD40 repeat protein/tRNA A-37 threonylcarbamoyl transferase component Bud32
MPDVPGYLILGELGRGGMAVVYRARQLGLNRPVALKLMLRADTIARARFLAEAEAAAAVRHPHVVQVFDFGEHAGTPFLAMEYLDGGTLADRLGDGKSVAPYDAAALVSKVATGVAAAHELGIVHRDLKPSNVLLDAAGEPRVADFGLAKRVAGSDLTHTQAIMGTPAYMAPEQARGAKFAGPPADVWALGVILYQCLTGRRPFAGDDVQAILNAVLNTEPVQLRKLVPGVPRDLDTIVSKCLTKESDGRYPTAKELADDLGRFGRGESIAARPAGPAERAVRWVRRKPTAAALYATLAAVLVLAGITAGALWLWREAEDSRAWSDRARGELATEKWLAESARREAEASLAREQQLKAAEAAARKDAEDARDAARRAEGEARHAEKDATDAREAAARVEYGRTLDLVGQHVRDGNLLRARELLHATRADLRGWEWGYLDRSTQRELMTIQTTGWHSEIQFRPDGRLFSTHQTAHYSAPPPNVFWEGAGEEDPLSDSVRDEVVWDADSGTRVRTRSAVYSPHTPFSRSADLRRVATARRDNNVLTVRVYETEADSEPVIFPRPGQRPILGGAQAVTLSPDGRQVAIATRATVRIWDVESGKELADPAAFPGESWLAAFGPDGWRVVVNRDKVLRVHDLTGKVLAEVPLPANTPRTITRMHLSPDGKRVVLVSGIHSVPFIVLDLTTGKEVLNAMRIPQVPWRQVNRVVFSPDGRRMSLALAAGPGGGGAWVWDAESGRPPVLLAGSYPTVGPVAFSPNGLRVAGGSVGGQVYLWAADTGALLLTLPGHRGSVTAAAFSPDERRLVTTGADHTIRVWDVGPWEPVTMFKAPPIAFGHSPDGWRVAMRQGSAVTIQNLRSGKTTSILTGTFYNGVFSPDGRLLATTDTMSVQIWNTDTGELVRTLGEGEGLYWMPVFSPDGNHVAATDPHGLARVRVWEVQTGRHVTDLVGRPEPKDRSAVQGPPPTRVTVSQRIEFTPNGRRLLLFTQTGELVVWDARTWERVGEFRIGTIPGLNPNPYGDPGAPGSGLAISPDGKLVLAPPDPSAPRPADSLRGLGPAVTGNPDAVVARWPDDCKYTPVFSPDSRRLAGIGPDDTVRIWDVSTGMLLLRLLGRLQIVMFSPDGQELLEANSNGGLILDSTPAKPVVVPLPIAPPPREARR